MAISIVLAILVTSLATYLSRFLGAVTSEKISEKSKIYRWFNFIININFLCNKKKFSLSNSIICYNFNCIK